MSLAVKLHETIATYNILEKPTQLANDFWRDHPNLYKIVLIANHIFRAAAMAFFMLGLPFSWPINTAICFAASLIYRLTVENNCAYKFALPAFAGSIAFPIARAALADMVSGAAFTALGSFAFAAVSLLPLAAYMSYIALTVSYDVDAKFGNLD